MATKLPWRRKGTGASVPGTTLAVWRDDRTGRYCWGIMHLLFNSVANTRDGAILEAEARLETLPASILNRN